METTNFKEQVNAKVTELKANENSVYAQLAKANEKFGTENEGTVGNNGVPAGTVVEVVGGIEAIPYDINGNTGKYAGFRLSNGMTVSLRNLMGLSSLAGYSTSLPEVKNDDEAKCQEAKTLDAVANLKEYRKWDCKSNKLSEVVAMLEGGLLTAPKKVKFWGKVGRVITFKKSVTMDGKDYYEGDKRQMEQSLWTVVQ